MKVRQLDVAANAYTVMGILNLTPDSFSDGGQFLGFDQALRRVEAMINEGAHIIDVGGESTRPGATPLLSDQEIERVVPVIQAIRQRFDIAISIDTSKASVMKSAVEAGADLINDVRALQEVGALEAAASLQKPVCLMHMQGRPRSMQQNPVYTDVVSEVKSFLETAISKCLAAGMDQKQLMIDPGFGFGKSLSHNLSLLKHIEQFVALGYPVLLGISRKSMLGALLDAEVDQRLAGGLATTVLGFQAGVKLFRVHDVKATVDALKVSAAVRAAL